MKKQKSLYCGMSLAFGTITLVLALILIFGQNTYAANPNGNNGITGETQQQIGELGVDQGGALDTGDNGSNGVSIQFNNDQGDFSGNIKILLFLTVISLAPSLLVLLTSFTRIIIVLHFVRNAVGTQTAPPNQVLVGLSLFLTLFIMSPIFTEINETALKPFDASEINQEEALEKALVPLREFMFSQTQANDLALFCDIAGVEDVDYEDEASVRAVPIQVVIPSFILSELRTAFIIGFLIYIPFIVIDMVVASVLMSMGMMMLPPTTISLPFKILLFVLADGWDLVIGNLVKTFY